MTWKFRQVDRGDWDVSCIVLRATMARGVRRVESDVLLSKHGNVDSESLRLHRTWFLLTGVVFDLKVSTV